MASGEVLGWPSIWDELAAGALREDAPVGVHTPPRLNLPNRRIRDPYIRWCGRREAVRPLPIPIRRQIQISQQVTRQVEGLAHVVACGAASECRDDAGTTLGRGRLLLRERGATRWGLVMGGTISESMGKAR
jgi:hypothetical protein